MRTTKTMAAVTMGALLLSPVPGRADDSAPFAGMWTLVAADVIRPDGVRTEDYGPSPHGLVIFTADGHYTLQIYRVARAKFASNDKFRGTAEEYKDASLGMSCHFGTYSVDSAKQTITLKIENASFSNLDGTTRTSAFEMKGDELTWRVPARPDGSIPITTFRRLK
jgi:Lipocalin-like domain